MEPNVDRGMWSVVALLAAIVIGGVVLLAFPKIAGKITNSMDDTVNKAFDGETPDWVQDDESSQGKLTFDNIEDRYENFLNTETKLEFEGDSNKSDTWKTYSKSSVNIKQNISVPEWDTDAATLIETTGGTHHTKYYVNSVVKSNGQCQNMPSGKMYYVSMYVKNVGEHTFRVSGPGTKDTFIKPGESRRVQKVVELKPTSCTQVGFTLEDTINVDKEIKAIAYKPVSFYADKDIDLLKESVKITKFN